MGFFPRCALRSLLGRGRVQGTSRTLGTRQLLLSLPHGGVPSAILLRYNTGGLTRTQERTLIAVKPDGVQRRLVGDVIRRFERRGFKLAPEKVLAEHYHDLKTKPFYPDLINYMSSGPVVAMVWEGYNVVRTSRAMVGDTDSAEAAPGTIRGDFSVHISRNVVHASDSVEVAQREISLWFHSSELVDWDCCSHSNLYHM
ncbi:nucleoside diphosphate kinase, mitochondrial isoform X2 [Phascolarctos cinereus]|uniref:Nucleoside diphosphate kinase n=1 Tax=Phascolarctos cinereus TaxID=38626 RepID=A0A6P5LUR3_PHACI|nr:nucleoside diphosphate kinase, mitochondrial isoform X2 [Phascolarctos cinereus]